MIEVLMYAADNSSNDLISPEQAIKEGKNYFDKKIKDIKNIEIEKKKANALGLPINFNFKLSAKLNFAGFGKKDYLCSR